VIDTSLASAPAKILEQLQAKGYQPGDVKRILLTHAHPDHVAGLPQLKALTGAQVIASTLEKPVIEGEMPVQRPPREALSGLARMIPPSETRFERTPVDRVVEDGETLTEVMEGLQVVATPGHAPGHIAFWQPDKRFLFCGDVIFHVFGLRLPLAPFTVDMAENIRSIRRLAELDASVVCFGHGNPLTTNAAQIIRTFARKVGAM
jgi:glyoxylase-like metal-dependent hydrolase (beta-lactamase superfamily II)